MNERDRIILKKILKYCNEIDGTHEKQSDNYDYFMSDEGYDYRNAISMPIQQIGELAKKLSDEFIKDHNEIPWRAIKGMRDYFAHGYEEMSKEEIWNTSKRNTVELKQFITSVIND